MPSQDQTDATSAPPEPTRDPIIGIDLGTTHSLVAYCDEAGPRILEGPGGQRYLPSVARLKISEKPPGFIVEALGKSARQHAVEYPLSTLHSVKRLMGRSLNDLGHAADNLPYTVVEGPHATARIHLEGSADPAQAVSPQQVSALYLAELKRWAEQQLGTPVHRAVVTVPAYFDDAQRQATGDAGRIAGLHVVRIVNEPTAAALAYGLDRTSKSKQTKESDGQQSIALNTKLRPQKCAESAQADAASPIESAPAMQTIAVYDLGGGTFDISILRLQQTEQGSIDQVLATDGDTRLGGDDFDQLIVDLFQEEIRQQLDQPALTFAPASMQAFRNFAEQTKIRLSTEMEAEVEIDLPDQQTVYRRTLSRSEFVQMVEPLIERTLDASRRAIDKSGVKKDAIDRVVLVGGSTRVPSVRQRVAALLSVSLIPR